MDDFEKQIAEIENSSAMKWNKFVKFLSNKATTFIAILIACWWIFYGTIKITGVSLDLSTQVILVITTIVMAISYTSLIADGGFTEAKNTEMYLSKKREYENAQRDGCAFQKEITDYAISIAKSNLKEVRKGNLQKNLIHYEDIFDDDGNVIVKDLKKYNKHQRKLIQKCIELKIHIPKIFGTLSDKFFGLKKEITQAEFESKNIIKSTIIKAILSFASVGIMFEFIGFSLASIIYALFQIALWSGSGYMQRIKNYKFVLEELLPQMESKTMIINSYLNKKKGELENGNNRSEE